jgi:hypothetical protein
VRLALQQGHVPEVICFEFENWSKSINERLKEQLEGVHILSVPAGRAPFARWFFSVLTENIYRIASGFTTLNIAALSQAFSRRSDILIAQLEKVPKPDLVIGHNPGAMYPAIHAAEKFGCNVGFDVEDYHPGEGNNLRMQKMVSGLMVKLLPRMNYVSFASSQILKEVNTLIPGTHTNWFALLNYFPASDFVAPSNDNGGKIKLVWFSQNISRDRGLELILPFVKKESQKLELHLFGNLDQTFHEEHLKGVENILVHQPLQQKELHQGLSGFDIGLALEPAKDRNNELAVSNKILAYLQSGLYVLATNTIAQESLLNEFPGHGRCFDYKSNNADLILEKIVAEIDSIRSKKMRRFSDFSKRNWETVATDLAEQWHQLKKRGLN